ncbi:MAG: hypothetical protein AAGD00_10270 [Planctomycetota bacterium]
MASDRPDTLVIADGGVPWAVAALMGNLPERHQPWVGPVGVSMGGEVVSEAMHRAVQELADIHLFAQPMHTSEKPERLTDTTGLLLAAARDARRLNCQRVLWPVCCGDDVTGLYRAAELAALLGRVVSVESAPSDRIGPTPEVVIEVPLADLTEAQVADLALDLDLATASCWFEQPGATPGEGSARWKGALRTAQSARLGHLAGSA